MKIFRNITLALVLLISFNSCNYLDVVPDEISTEDDAFTNPNAARGFMYSCYGYLPNPRGGSNSLDWFTGDEVISAFEHEPFANFPKGNYTAINPGISYWNTLFQGIKQCYILKRRIGSVPNLEESLKEDYIAQADFLIGYYHFLLLKCYGPIILVKEEPEINTPPSEYLGRSPYDECVEFIATKFNEAIPKLPDTREDIRLGLATSVAAKGVLSRLYLYAASPLFNGNPEYAGFKNPDGTQLISSTYDAQKWVRAKEAAKEAITSAEAVGIRLYTATDAVDSSLPEPADLTQRGLRFNILDKNSKENLWVDARGEGNYSLQNKSTPYWTGSKWNGLGLTLEMLDRFYTEKGLPVKEDPDFDYNSRFDVIDFPAGDINGEGKTSRMNINREPRYYAWVSFHGGYYECQGKAENNERNERWAYLQKYKRGINDKKLVTFFTKNDNCGKHNRTNNYSPAGTLNKKGVSPAVVAKNGSLGTPGYPWPLIRLAEVYLNYAEACVETNDLNEAKIYINKIRERAGIPTLEVAWGGIGVNLTQDKLRDIVRQERQIELYLEGHNFWDMRRWLLAEKYFNATPKGFNIEGATLNEYSQETELDIVRKFTKSNYLLPIPYGEIQKNINLVQNPGY